MEEDFKERVLGMEEEWNKWKSELILEQLKQYEDVLNKKKEQIIEFLQTKEKHKVKELMKRTSENEAI